MAQLCYAEIGPPSRRRNFEPPEPCVNYTLPQGPEGRRWRPLAASMSFIVRSPLSKPRLLYLNSAVLRARKKEAVKTALTSKKG
jgi:hypothetical protein